MMMMMMMMKMMVVVMILMMMVVVMIVNIINGPSAKSKHACEHPNQIGKKTLAIDDDDEDDKLI